MYEEYIEELKQKYNFADIKYNFTHESGFKVTVCLTSNQLTKFNYHINELDMMIKKAELYSVQKSHITLGMVPKTEVFRRENI